MAKSIMYIVVRMDCSEDKEVFDTYSNKLDASINFSTLDCENEVGTIKLISFNGKTCVEKVLRQYTKTQEDVDRLNNLRKEFAI